VAINPPSDIVLGVANAADPQRYRAAAERLQRLSSMAADGVGPQAPSQGAASPVASPSLSPGLASETVDIPRSRAVSARRAVTSPKQLHGTSDAFAQLEAFILQHFIQSMLPKNASTVFGKGTAGEIWKSMLAEKLGGEVAKSGHIGIASRLQTATAASRTHIAAAALGLLQRSASLASVLPYLPSAAALDRAKS
jgi:hypothetical protein